MTITRGEAFVSGWTIYGMCIYTVCVLGLGMTIRTCAQEQHRGDLQEQCNPDGACNAPGLFCGVTLGGSYRCFPKGAK